MTQHLTPDLITQALAKYEYTFLWTADGKGTLVVDKSLAGGGMRVTLYGIDDAEVDCRTFRLVEVTS